MDEFTVFEQVFVSVYFTGVLTSFAVILKYCLDNEADFYESFVALFFLPMMWPILVIVTVCYNLANVEKETP